MNFLKKYLPDILIQIGVLMFSYVTLFPISGSGSKLKIKIAGYYNYTDEFKMVALIFISIGINIAIRKYLASKNNKK